MYFEYLFICDSIFNLIYFFDNLWRIFGELFLCVSSWEDGKQASPQTAPPSPPRHRHPPAAHLGRNQNVEVALHPEVVREVGPRLGEPLRPEGPVGQRRHDSGSPTHRAPKPGGVAGGRSPNLWGSGGAFQKSRQRKAPAQQETRARVAVWVAEIRGVPSVLRGRRVRADRRR